ncbi:MAG: M23 family metallopeptidase [Lactobacillaceae bacterium]|jgi:murein DD-endopeptidase MepM/ murein hydrolase activator NlpD|nr:M23 family metallopeptidase [Lactobacillaceae bacterium]
MILSFPVKAETVKICGTLAQGQIITGHAPNAKKVLIEGKDIKLTKDGKFIYAFSRDSELLNNLEIDYGSGETKNYILSISETKWDIQNLKGVEQKKVTPSKQDEKEIARERNDIRAAQNKTTENTFWEEVFSFPVEGRESGKFGGQRIMNGSRMNPHAGMDIAAMEGTPIKAPADGIITLSGQENYFYSGNVVVIDHGYNLYTIYAHILDTKVNAGNKVKKGDILGTVGKTGRVTGAHLHWGASLNDVRFDPKSLLKKDDLCINL